MVFKMVGLGWRTVLSGMYGWGEEGSGWAEIFFAGVWLDLDRFKILLYKLGEGGGSKR